MVLALGQPAAAGVGGVLVFATAVWVGGMVTLVILTRLVRRLLAPPDQVRLMRRVGQVHLLVGTAALGLALAAGAVLVYGRPWRPVLVAAVVLACAIVVALAAGVVQARQMTRMRRAAAAPGADPALRARVRRGTLVATALRMSLLLLSLALIGLGAALTS